MIRASLLLPLALLACSEPEESASPSETEERDAPVKDIDDVPVDEDAAAAVGENDDAPAEEED